MRSTSTLTAEMNSPPKPTDTLIDYKRFAFVLCYFDNNFIGAIAVKVELVNKTDILGVFPIFRAIARVACCRRGSRSRTAP